MAADGEADMIHHLPPSPLRSPTIGSAPEVNPLDERVHGRKNYLPSVLSILRTTHRYSAYTFSAFSIIHFLNTGVAPLFSRVNDLSFADENLTAARALYRNSYLSEAILVFGALGVHVVSGVVIRVIRIAREYIWYRHKARIPQMSWNSVTGYLIIPFVTGHFLATRYIPRILDIDVTASFIGHWVSTHPRVGWTFYSAFVTLSALHMTNGLSQWLGWTNKYRYRANAAVVGLWLLGLIKVVAHGVVDGFKGRQYDAVNDALVSQFQYYTSA